MESFKYSVDDMFYLKKRDQSGSILLNYEQIPGLSLPDATASARTTFEECKYDCSKNEGCSGFFFTAKSKLCSQTKFGFIEFNSDWDYYEKDLVHVKVDKEPFPEEKMRQATKLKLMFEEQADRMKKIRSEQAKKGQKKREALREKTIANEQRLKKIQQEQLTVNDKFQKSDMAKSIITDALDQTRKQYRKYLRADGKLADQLISAKTLVKNANNKEVKEKAEIDVQYLSRKMVTSRLQAKQMKEDIATKKPQEVKSKLDFSLSRKAKGDVDSQQSEDSEELELSEAKVNLAEKEKATQAIISKIADLKSKVAQEGQKKPFDEKQLEAYKEQLMKARAQKKSAVEMQKRFKSFVKRIIDKNSRKHEATQKLVSKKMDDKHKEQAEKSREKKIQEEKDAKAKTKAMKDEEIRSKKQAEVSQKDKEMRQAKEKGDKAAEKEEKQLAKEESEKAQQRAKHAAEQKVKAEANAVMHQREADAKHAKAQEAKKELDTKYTEMQAYEKALEVSEKAEEKAKEDNEKAVEQREKDQKGAKEAALKKDVKKMGFEKMQKKKEAREELADKQMLKEGKEKVLVRKKKKANMDCKSECIAAGKKKEETTTPMFLGCYKDQEKSPAMSMTIAAFDVNTPAWCNQKCISNSPLNRYFALSDNKCFCSQEGEQYDRYGVAHEDQCILPCSGDRDQLCGGPSVNRVFLTMVTEGAYEWGGYTKNASVPLAPQNFNFEVGSSCQCVGKPANADQKTLDVNQPTRARTYLDLSL